MCNDDACCQQCSTLDAMGSELEGVRLPTKKQRMEDPEQVKSYGEVQYPEAFEDGDYGMAPWVLPQDRIPLRLAISLYTQPIDTLGSFKLFGVQPRSGAWYSCDLKTVIIGLRGTAAFQEGFGKDLLDDLKIAFGDGCGGSLVDEASGLVDELLQQESVESIIFAGHSLGGTSAFCLCEKYENSIAVCLNMGSPPSNPVTKGPGPERAVHYHIVGDFISSHLDPEAAEIIRISFRDINFRDVFWAHESGRALKSDLAWSYSDVNIEDYLWQEFGDAITNTALLIDVHRFFTPVPNVVDLFIGYMKIMGGLRGLKSPIDIPIPGSLRYLGGSYDPSILNGIWTTAWGVIDILSGLDPFSIINKAKALVKGARTGLKAGRRAVTYGKSVIRQVKKNTGRISRLGRMARSNAMEMTRLSVQMSSMAEVMA